MAYTMMLIVVVSVTNINAMCKLQLSKMVQVS
jgi:hypothetical protein